MIAIDPPKRLEMTFLARWDPELEAEGPVRQVWELDPAERRDEAHGHHDRPQGRLAGWPRSSAAGSIYIVSGLKTLVEGGRAAVAAG